MSEKSVVSSINLDSLNPPQREAVQHYLGPIVILAGAGTGKTRVLTHRVVNLIRQHKVYPDRILAVTFTNKAAGEMRERLHTLLGAEAERVWISTFHSAGLRILRRNADRVGYSSDFTIYDDQDSTALMKRLLKQLSIADKQHPPGKFLSFIDAAKNQLQRPQDLPLNGRGYDYRLKVEVYDKYQLELRKAKAMDFGDLLINAVYLLRENQDILHDYQRQLQFVLVDEFQDTNPAQYEMVRLITAHHRNLLVVGDDDQSIYAFRGATIEHIREFDKDFRDAKVVKLEQNYRSTGNILAAAHSVIEKSEGRRDKKLWTASGKGGPVIAISAEDEHEEAELVVKEILALKAGGSALNDIAVFYRTNAQSRVLEDALMRHQVPYRIYGGLRFYDRKEIKDIIAYLRIIVNPADSEALLRIINVPARGIGAQTLAQVLDHAAKNAQTVWESVLAASARSVPLKRFVTIIEGIKAGIDGRMVGEVIGEVLERSGYEASLKASEDLSSMSRLENLSELRVSAESNGLGYEALRNFLDKVALASSADNPKESEATSIGAEEIKPDFVALMTLHLAKGLEFPTVFFTGFEEGLVPHYRSIDEGNVDEERRLCYVGMTRAKENLYLTRCDWRGMFSSGGGGSRYVSRFAYDISADLIYNLKGRFTYLTDSDVNDFDEDSQIIGRVRGRAPITKERGNYQSGAFGFEGEDLEGEVSEEERRTNVIQFNPLAKLSSKSFGSSRSWRSNQDGQALNGGDFNVDDGLHSSQEKKVGSKFQRAHARDNLSSLVKTGDQLRAGQGNLSGISGDRGGEGVKSGGRLLLNDEINTPSDIDVADNSSTLVPLQELIPGVKVRHILFGIGEVLAVEGAGQPEQSKVSVCFEERGEKIKKRLVYKYAKLRYV